ncbi:DUF1631 family protein [Dokdonella soli]|uniref:DUF1631 domain-containing protein n=1 Tax=Dokdonella soli TaxID=529810 RepID=A0ABP3TVP0_9GAMM
MRGLLDGLLELTFTHFESAILRTLDETEHALFKLAERSSSSAQQQKRFEGLREVRHGRADVAPRFLQHVESIFTRIRGAPKPPPAPDTADPSMPLELIDAAVLEEDLALQEIIGKSEIRNSQVLYALAHRLGVLAGTPAWPHDTMPLGPAQLAAAFRCAMQPLDLDTEHRVLAYRQFDRLAMLPIAPFYESVNAYLVAQRVLPNLQMPAGYRRGDSAREALAEQAALEPVLPRDPPEAAPVHDGGDQELFKTLRSLLAEQRRLDGDVPGISEGQVFSASQSDVQSVLGALQRSPGTRATANAAYDSEHFRNTLLVKLRRASPEGRPLRLAEEDSDTVDLIGMLFDHITRSMHGSAGALGLLARLHVPVLRVALDDKTFFTRRDHPARLLLNTIAETAVHWIDDSESDPDLVKKMQIVVDHVSADFDGDVSVFGNLLDDLGRHMQLLARRAEVVERRHVDAAKGRDKLDIARETARSAIVHVLQEGTPTLMVRSLLEHAWTDALALSALRSGKDGSEFKRRVAVAEQLARAAPASPAPEPEPVDAALREDIDAGLRQVGLHDDDVRGVLDNLFPAPGTAPVAAPEHLDRISSALKDKTRLGGGNTDRHAAPVRSPVTLTDAEAEMLERLRKIPFGTWFEFVTNQQGQSVRRKLAWFSTMTGRCLFVNQRGARTEDTTLEQLARDMARGQARVAATEQLSLIDRAWKAIMATLRPQAADPAEAPRA